MSDFQKYQCLECEHIYDEAKGDPDSGIAPETRWADIPDSWNCPICGAPKSFFKLMDSH
jgi:rubredoxin